MFKIPLPGFTLGSGFVFKLSRHIETGYNGVVKEPQQKKSKFSFEEMKAAATSNDPQVRKNVFLEYFERFGEFPSYLFDNEREVDSRLSQTIEDLKKSPEATEAMQKGLAVLLSRLPSRVLPEGA